MLADSKAFSGFAVDDIDAAREFYGETLGLDVEVSDGPGLLQRNLPGERGTLIYPKPDHEAANYTILNFPVDDIDAAVAGLAERGVEFERYEGTELETDETGVFRGGGPLIAWFKDPAGNVLSVIESSGI
jgi:catechol 2,3-dioxygenase-like lactoylglutathione lyase family enzyme